MPYIINTSQDQQLMLESIGLESLEQLFDAIPDDFRLQRPLDLPAALSEMELEQQLGKLAGHNHDVNRKTCFLGGGSYDHFVPAVVDAIASRSEFYTSYTPYQPEVSQGNLQAMFEYQSLICQLTGMDVSNASLYEGGTATLEAVLMAMSVTRRDGKIITLESVHPEYRRILKTYLDDAETELVTLPTPSGSLALDMLDAELDDQTACVVIQHPNFFGCLEDVAAAAELAHQRGALVVHIFDPISLGILKRPGELGVDIAVAEGQSLGTPLLYGGPYLGIMACREQFVRRLPGRIAGQTVDQQGKRCWVLTLQTREQHIRRHKATSNICTNQGLLALRAAIYLATMGPLGMQEAADLCLQKTHYAQEQISSGARFESAFAQPVFKEFVVRDHENQVVNLLRDAEQAGILGGIPLGTWYPDLADCFLVTVTEKRTRQEIDTLVHSLAGESSHISTIHA
jgi:glycine dehydrogenase subunit 1